MDKQKLFSTLDERIVKTLDLTDFHERFVNDDGSHISVEVWVNPPSTKMQELLNIEDVAERGRMRIGMQIGLTIDESKELFSKDAPFCEWLVDRIMQMHHEYAEGRRKKSVTG